MTAQSVLALLAAVLVAMMAATGPANATTARTASVKCSAHALFEAAVKKEHFNPNDPSYKTFGKYGNKPGAYNVVCDRGWSVALISRPNVGTTDGNTLFKAARTVWVESAQLGPAVAECNVEKAGVPVSIAKVLAHGHVHSGSVGC